MIPVMDVLVGQYAIKLTNFGAIQDATLYNQLIEIDGPLYKQRMELNTKLATQFILPAISGKDIQFTYQYELSNLLHDAREQGIIDKADNIPNKIKKKRFINIFLSSCKLPQMLFHDDTGIINYDDCLNIHLFHSLTYADVPHIILEQICLRYNKSFTPDLILEKKWKLDSALQELGYSQFTNHEEIERAIGTNGTALAYAIANEMTVHTK